MDIKELAQDTIDEMWPGHGTLILHENDIVDFATRLIASYTEGQEPVAWIAVGGATDLKGGVYRKLFWQQSNARNGWGREWKPLYSAPPEPAPQPAATTTPEEIVGYTVAPVVCAAPSSDEVAQMVERLRDIIYVNPNDAADMIERLAARATDLHIKHEVACGTITRQRADIDAICGYMDALKKSCERIAARVPDGCVVVPKEPTEAMCLAGQDHPGCYQVFKAMIAVGEVK